MTHFIGRKEEINLLKNLENSPRAILAVIKGRRRIGKSRLVEEFAKGKHFLSFSGLAPVPGMTSQDQRNEFARRLSAYLSVPQMTFLDWGNAFDFLTQAIQDKPTVILLDEISWMAHKDPLFVGKLKIWWDTQLQKFPQLTVVLCGSVSTWIEENILKSTALFGRISAHIALKPFSLRECHDYFVHNGFSLSAYDFFKILSVTGGIPWYLEQLNPRFGVDDMIKELFFKKNAFLLSEYDRIFHDLFENRGDVYKKIIQALVGGMKTLAQLRTELDYAHGGGFTPYLDNLELSGFVTKHASWSLRTGKTGRSQLYRLSDNFLRFYLKYVAPRRDQILQGKFDNQDLNTLPGWDGMMGFQVENLLLQNRTLLLQAIHVSPQDVVSDNPYVQTATKTHEGCQIDYLVQTRSNTLYAFEFKFRRRELDGSIIPEMRERIKKLNTPKGYAISPVLVHVCGVHESVAFDPYFFRVVDAGNWII